MPTSCSTRATYDAQNRPYFPRVLRLFSETNFTSGSTGYSVVIAGLDSVVRVTCHVTAMATGSTLSLSLFTAGQLVPGANVKSSSGALVVNAATTGVHRWTFAGLDRIVQLYLSEAGGTGASTGIFIDGEFL